MLAEEDVPVQTIAPKFHGRFNKGVDYVGDLGRFEAEFDADLGVLAWAVRELGLPPSLKLSVHSGSDKFAIYPVINRLIRRHGAGLHVKTAGTTWLEEIAGVAAEGGGGLRFAKELYRGAFDRMDALVAPYRTVVEIAPDRLPNPDEVDQWTGAAFAAAVRHDQQNPAYNPDLRQLLHVGFKLAAERINDFRSLVREHADPVSLSVTANLHDRHLIPLFQGVSP